MSRKAVKKPYSPRVLFQSRLVVHNGQLRCVNHVPHTSAVAVWPCCCYPPFHGVRLRSAPSVDVEDKQNNTGSLPGDFSCATHGSWRDSVSGTIMHVIRQRATLQVVHKRFILVAPSITVEWSCSRLSQGRAHFTKTSCDSWCPGTTSGPTQESGRPPGCAGSGRRVLGNSETYLHLSFLLAGSTYGLRPRKKEHGGVRSGPTQKRAMTMTMITRTVNSL